MFTTTSTLTRHRPRPSDTDSRLNPWLLWRLETQEHQGILSVAELADCTCPDLCDRDHANE